MLFLYERRQTFLVRKIVALETQPLNFVSPKNVERQNNCEKQPVKRQTIRIKVFGTYEYKSE